MNIIQMALMMLKFPKQSINKRVMFHFSTVIFFFYRQNVTMADE